MFKRIKRILFLNIREPQSIIETLAKFENANTVFHCNHWILFDNTFQPSGFWASKVWDWAANTNTFIMFPPVLIQNYTVWSAFRVLFDLN